MHYRRLVLTFVTALALFVAGNYAIWKSVTEDLITDHHFDGGDLSRMGYVPGSKMYRHNATDLPRRHIHLKDYDGRPVDMITIGDSFSNGGGGGYNRFYQDYIASINNLEILNLNNPIEGVDFISTIATLLNNGFIEHSHARYILISFTETSWKNFARHIDFDQTIPMSELEKRPRVDHYGRLPHVPFINNGNLKFLIFNTLYPVSDHALFGQVYKARLTRPFFSGQAANQLLYLPYRSLPSAGEVRQINDNLNELANRLASRGIRLVFLPFVNKYTLYAPWLETKRFPESAFFELLRPLPKRYTFIDTKALLREELARGEKDVYYADDTHSSWKAAWKIFSSVRFPK